MSSIVINNIYGQQQSLQNLSKIFKIPPKIIIKNATDSSGQNVDFGIVVPKNLNESTKVSCNTLTKEGDQVEVKSGDKFPLGNSRVMCNILVNDQYIGTTETSITVNKQITPPPKQITSSEKEIGIPFSLLGIIFGIVIAATVVAVWFLKFRKKSLNDNNDIIDVK
jgi:hypothetical protein